MLKLVIEDDEGNRTIVDLIRDEISIGRRKGNTIRLNERNVSRDHAKLIREEDIVYLEDQASRYHTYCNGIAIDGRVKFKLGDIFSIGDYALSLQSDAVKDIAEAATAPLIPSSLTPAKAPRGEGTEIIVTNPGKLVVTSSNFAGQSFPLTGKEMLVGRGEECDIIIDHRSVSTRHAKVVREANGSYQIVDLDSKNGIKVSGEEYQSIRLKRGDTIEMGHVRFRFVEPGENYVFAPQSGMDFKPQKGTSWLFPVLGVVLLLIAVGAYIGLAGDDPKTDEKPVAVTKVGDNNENIERIIEGARTHIRKGKIDKAIAKLETAKMLSPDSGQTAEIEKMLSEAVIWSSLARALDIGEDNLKAKRYGPALEKFKEISIDTSTPIYQIMSEKGLPKKAIAGLLSKAKKAHSSGNLGEAKEAVNAVLLYDAENSDAIMLNRKLGNVKVAVIPKVEKGVSKVKDVDKKDKQEKAPKKRVKKPKFQKDPVLGKALYKEGFGALTKGNNRRAISKCRLGLQHGNRSCNRIIGLAYKNLNNMKQACRYYKRAGMSTSKLDCK